MTREQAQKFMDDLEAWIIICIHDGTAYGKHIKENLVDQLASEK